MNALLIGHSFIRRLVGDSLLTSAVDVRFENTAISLSRNLELDFHFSGGLYTICKNINLIHHLYDTVHRIRDLLPDIIVIELGSNDIANLTNTNSSECLRLADQLVEFAKHCIASKLTKAVIINSVIPRNSRISCSAEQFIKNITIFNNCVRRFCNAAEQLYFNKIRGFYHPQKINNFWWSSDGIHCNTTEGKRMYRARLRHGLLFFKPSAGKVCKHHEKPLFHIKEFL